MNKLNTKITLHIPEYFHDETGLIPISEEILQELYFQLQDANYDFFIITAETYYKNRTYTTKLVTSYTNDEDQTPISIFKQWFKDNNDKLNQESLAYEYNNTLIIEEME